MESRDIYIISDGTCTLNLDKTGTYRITLTNVKGIYNTPVIAKGDYYEYLDYELTPSGKQQLVKKRGVIEDDIASISGQETIASINPTLGKFEDVDPRFHFTKRVVDMSPRLKYLFGIRDIPTTEKIEYATFTPSLNGTPYLLVNCRNIQGLCAANANQFTFGSSFVLEGGEWIADANEVNNIIFDITGYYGETMSFTSEILWCFHIEQISASSPTRSKNSVFNMM